MSDNCCMLSLLLDDVANLEVKERIFDFKKCKICLKKLFTYYYQELYKIKETNILITYLPNIVLSSFYITFLILIKKIVFRRGTKTQNSKFNICALT